MKIFNKIILLLMICSFSVFSACSSSPIQSEKAVIQSEYIHSKLKAIQPKYPNMVKFFESIEGEKTINELKRALNDDDDTVRAYAAAAFVVLIGENWIPGMGTLPDERALEELTESLQDQSPIVRSTAAVALSKSGDADATRNALIALSKIIEDKNQSWVVHEFSAYCIGEIGDKRAIPTLLTALKNKTIDPIVYPAILRSLGKIRDTRAVPDIINILNANPEDSYICDAGLIALGEIGSDVSVSFLINYLNNSEYKNVCRMYAAHGLARTTNELASSILIDALNDPNPNIRISAADALSLYFESNAVKELIRLLDDKNKYVRLNAVVLLGEIGNHEIVPLLKLRLNDEWQKVVDESKEAIEKIGKRNNQAAK